PSTHPYLHSLPTRRSSDLTNTVSYAECHDNHVLWDKLELSVPEASFEERKAMYKLALSIVLTSQGISFLHAGSEFLRTKHGNERSEEHTSELQSRENLVCR